MNLKVHLDKEKENTQTEEKKNKLLRDQIQRTNKILRMKNNKYFTFYIQDLGTQ